VLYRTEVVGSCGTQGRGTLTPRKHLIGVKRHGLTYRYLDDKTVTIVPTPTGPAALSRARRGHRRRRRRTVTAGMELRANRSGTAFPAKWIRKKLRAELVEKSGEQTSERSLFNLKKLSSPALAFRARH